MMTHRERVVTAINHGRPDVMPFDIGGTYASGINIGAYAALKARLGIETPSVTKSRRSQTATIEPIVRERLGLDTLPIFPRTPFQPKEEFYADGSYKDEWGVTRNRPADGHFYVTREAFGGELTHETLARHPWPDPEDPGYVDGLRAEAERARQTDYAIVMSLPIGLLHQATFLRGMENLFVDMVGQPALAEDLLDRVIDIQIRITERMLDAAGDLVDAVIFADDMGAGDRTLLSPAIYRRMIKPRQKRLVDRVHQMTGAKVIFHSCGAIFPIIPDLIEVGVDVLNPIQPSAAGMDPVAIKREFGRDLVFWGGMDIQMVLPFGTPEETRTHVRRMVDALGPDGYVVSPTNHIQRDVPPANLIAAIEAARE